MKIVSNRPGFLWQAIIIFLLFFDGLLLFLSIISNLRTNTLYIISEIDLIISLILLILFIWSIFKVEDKKNYIKNQWSLLLCFVPIYFIAINLGLLEYTILLKLLNIVKIISLYFFGHKFSRDVIKYQEKTRLVYAIAIFLLVLIVCSFVFYAAEHSVNPQVSNFEDSIWFVLQTITTVGYGDIIPITAIGRIMGVISMLSALVLTSIVTSVATFSLIEKFRKGTELATHRTKEKVEELDGKLDDINHRLDGMDNSESIGEMKRDLQDLKTDIDEIKEYISKKS
ncbi:MAG: Voltage-gated potassium channel [Methanobacterium sp. PtaU1.Bin097]|mgnify:FL=1|jgi:voltage-gated potassium channel|nr:MAG: Voltage-gated potassium channel [Methanobacterium sp. PtaU1.Bin097]